VAQRLFDGAATAPSLPDLDQIAVSSAGALDVRGGAAVDDPVRRFGQLLQAMLTLSEPPVQLRLLIAQATAPEPVFSSIREYDRALEFFDRPNRAAVLQALFARAAAAPAPAQVSTPATVEAIAPLPVARTTIPPRERTAVSGRTTRRVAVAAACVLAALAGVLYARSAGVMPESRLVSNAALEASDTVGTAITTGLSAVSEKAGLGRLVFGSELPDAAPAIVEAAVNDKSPQVRRTARTEPRLVGVTVLDLDAASLAHPAAVLPSFEPFDEDVIEAVTHVEEDAGTYALGAEGVSPPVGLRPHLPRELPAGVDVATIGRMELIILPDGTVESAKLIGPPRSVVDSMLLSAAKAWEFQPAVKEGRPVRYRKTVWIASH
jgi:hypothetical protein